MARDKAAWPGDAFAGQHIKAKHRLNGRGATPIIANGRRSGRGNFQTCVLIYLRFDATHSSSGLRVGGEMFWGISSKAKNRSCSTSPG